MSLENARLIEVSVEASLEAVDDVLGLLSRHCSGGAAVDEHREGPVWEPQERVTVKGYLDEHDTETLQKLEIALLLLSRTGAISEPTTRLLEAADWAESWKAFFPPLLIGERFVVVPSWVEYQVPEGRLPLYIDPGMAFGTGLHATTRLCLIALERQPVADTRVLDVGTGSGILAIAAALLGAAQVDAMDVDPVCVQVSQENAQRNGVASRIQVERATLPSRARTGVAYHQGSGYDLLLINILAEIIIDMAASLPPRIRPGGVCIASGILQEKVPAVSEALEGVGLSILDVLIEDGWAALVLSRPA
ncbi:MAG: 50S ribosomal protein L11 methyltransferase [Anaerolineae bacterium]|jgi:ribosomal protein L11 methyltransferase|nr:50S ribosomal protein L11 methyltransferase [Chloroflexota bacterium]